ncbi:sigma-70 family RNA polymerase sigma factor [Nonomuraea rubra]
MRALHLHCYRMLGSLDQAEDAVQETLLRAWRGLDGFQGRAPLHHWLHRIATMACLRAVERRGRLPAVHAEIAHLQPYPDTLLDPALVAERREEVALAFVAALQLLPATQRAVVILREVLCWSAAEVAALLGVSVPAVNSSLQRGRAALRSRAAAGRPLDAYEQQLLRRFVRSWQRRDLDTLAALLREDVILRMPPEQVEIAANGQPALAAYLPDGTGTCRGCCSPASPRATRWTRPSSTPSGRRTPTTSAATRPRRSVRSVAAFAAPGVLERPFAFMGATVPGAVLASISLHESLIHGWDIATGAGQPHPADEDVVRAVWQYAESGVGEAQRRAGQFAEAIPVPPAAPPLVRLLAHVGRPARP